jgi:uncharacterized Zn finger protein (UPF0148 family)
MATLQDMIKKLQRFGDEIQDVNGKKFTLLPDQNGMLDRQCPQCNEVFMIADGDFEKLKDGTYCPSCGHKGSGSDFITERHHKAVKEAIEKSLHSNWNHGTSIPDPIIKLESILGLEDQKNCANCNSTF